jgi:hypothetical protein
MNRQQFGTNLGDGMDASGHAIGNIVELQIEEDPVSAGTKRLNKPIASGIVEFHADFEPAAAILQSINKIESQACVRDVKRNGQPIFWID